jgi:xylulokinase
MYTIGLDIGTSAAKGVLLNTQSGAVEAESHYTYQIETDGDKAEIDAYIYIKAVEFIIAELIKNIIDSDSKITALSVSSQAETLICVDKNGKPLRKAIVWLDNRSGLEAIEIQNHFGVNIIFQKTGQPEVVPTWPATKILWLRNNEPNIFNNTYKFLLVEDFVLHYFTGKFVTEPSVSSSALYLDIHTRNWWSQMLDYLGITINRLPEILPSGTKISLINNQQSKIKNCKIVTGSYDHVAGAIGAGNIKPGMVSETTGSSMAMVVTTERPIISSKVAIPCQIHPFEGLYFMLPYGQTAGMTLKWFMQTFCKEEEEKAIKSNADVYDLLTELAAQIPAGSDGLVMLPHLAGAGSPEFNTECKGVYAGFTLHMQKAHFVRAIMESVAAMICKNLEALKAENVKIEQILALGGGAKSPLWNQIKADMALVPITTLKVKETPALGAAIIAAVSVGLFPDYQTACEKTVVQNQTFIPNLHMHEAYKNVLMKYNKLYNSLEGYW